MACDADVLKNVRLFSLLDGDERSMLAAYVEVREFEKNHRIYKMADPGGRAYVLLKGKVRVSTIDEDNQDLTVDEPEEGGFFGFASMLDGSSHQTAAVALSPVTCIEIDRSAIETLIRKKPDAGMDMLAILGRQFHSAQHLVRIRSLRNPNELIAEKATLGDRLADSVAQFGGSWRFIILFGAVLIVYTAANVVLGRSAWDPYPFILLNLFLSMLAAIQAPVIMMSQNRQDAKDRMRGELDFDVNRRAESEIRALASKMNNLGEKMSDIEERLRINSGQ